MEMKEVELSVRKSEVGWKRCSPYKSLFTGLEN